MGPPIGHKDRSWFNAHRAWFAVWLLPALLFSFPGMAQENDRPIRFEALLFEGGEGREPFEDCASAYEEVRPHVKVDMYLHPRIADKVRIRVLEGTYPELTNAGIDYWPLILQGLILPLDEFLDGPNWEDDSTWRESFLPGSLDLYTYEGKTYGVPLTYHALSIWYNKGMFEKHGWEPARTWDEFSALCEQIKSKGISPLAFQGRYPSYARMLINSVYYQLAGPERFEAQNNLEPGSFDNPEFGEALRLVQKIGSQYFQRGAMGMSHTEAQRQFFIGKAAMVPCGSWLKSEMKGKIPKDFRLGTFNFPAMPGGKGDPTAINVGSGFFFVMKRSREPRQAVDFLRFITSRERAAEFWQRDIPVAVKGVSEENLADDLRDLGEMIKASRTSYGSGRYLKDMQQHWSDACFSLLRSDPKTPEQIAADLEAQAAGIRSRWSNPDSMTRRHFWKPVALLALLASMPVYLLVMLFLRVRARARQKQRPHTAGRLRLSWKGILVFIGPAALLYTVFVVVPCVKSFVWCLYRWDGLTEMSFKGFLHFKRLLFESDGFWIALRNNLFLMFVIPLFVLPLSLFLAACISRGVKGSRFIRATVLFPNIMGVVAATVLWMQMFNPGGLINQGIAAIGQAVSAAGLGGIGGWLEGFMGFAWLSTEHLYKAIVPISIWGVCGFNVILLLAAMESIPQRLYEAAEIDGASHWRQFWTITLPLIRNVLAIAMVFMVIVGMKAFEMIWLLTDQRPATQTHVIGTRMVQAMFSEFKVGEATAIAVLLFLMIFYGAAVTLRLMTRERVEV